MIYQKVLSCYQKVWKNYFKNIKTFNCGISGDKREHVLWRARDLLLPPSPLNSNSLKCIVK